MSSTTITESRNGFAWLKDHDPKLYDHFRKFMLKCIDWYDWVYLHANGISKPRANTKDALNYWLVSDGTKKTTEHARRLRKLSFKRLEESTQNHDRTVYFVSNPTSHLACIMVDIDNKAGQYTDVDRVYQCVHDLLVPEDLRDRGIRLFDQVSTFGRGHHGYFFVQYPDISTESFRQLVDDVQEAIRNVVAVRFPHWQTQHVELKGHPSIVRPNGSYKLCGQAAKFPRLGTDPDLFRQFLRSPAIGVQHLRGLVGQYGSSDSVPTNSSRREREQRGVPDDAVDAAIEAGLTGSPAALPPSGTISGNKRKTSQSGNPAKRMADCGWNLSVQLRRAATAEEVLADYNRQGLGTGEDDDGNRAKLAHEEADWLAKHFDPTKLTRAFNYDDYKGLIACVTEDIRERVRVKNRSAYTDLQLAVVLYTVELNSLKKHVRDDYTFGCPNNAFTQMFNRLGTPLDGQPDAQRRKLAAMKQALTDAGLIVCVDQTYRFNCADPRGKKYGLGPMHPRHAEFLKLAGR